MKNEKVCGQFKNGVQNLMLIFWVLKFWVGVIVLENFRS